MKKLLFAIICICISLVACSASKTVEPALKVEEPKETVAEMQDEVSAVITLLGDNSITSNIDLRNAGFMLNDSDKEFKVEFNQEMDRKSVEGAFFKCMENMPESIRNIPKLLWQDGKTLIIKYSNLKSLKGGDVFYISFQSAKSLEGKEYNEAERGKPLSFVVNKTQQIKFYNGLGEFKSLIDIPVENFRIGRVSSDGRYILAYRVIANADGDFYPQEPVLLDIEDGKVKKYKLYGTDYQYGSIVENAWMPDAKSFIIYDSKKLFYGTVDNTKAGKPVNVIINFKSDDKRHIVGCEPSPDGSRIAVFYSQYESDGEVRKRLLNLLIIDANGNELGEVKTLFNYRSSDGFPLPLRFMWKDNSKIVTEGFSDDLKSSAVYEIYLDSKSVLRLYGGVASPFAAGEYNIFMTETKWTKEGNYLLYGSSKIINTLENKQIFKTEETVAGKVFETAEGKIVFTEYKDGYNTIIFDPSTKEVYKIQGERVVGIAGDTVITVKE